MSDLTVNTNSAAAAMAQAAMAEGAEGAVAQAANTIQNLASVLAGANVNVTTAATGTTTTTRTSTAAKTQVVLDEAEVSDKSEIDIEALVAKLQIDMDETSAKTFLAQLKEMNKRLDAEHTETMNKISESIEKAEKAAKASKWQKALGWLGAIVAVVVAVAVTVVTGGAAAAFAIAGAAMAVGTMVMDETGATEKIVNALAKSMAKTFHLSDAEAKAWAAGVWGGIMLVASILLSVTGGGIAHASAKAAQLAGTGAKVAQAGAQVAQTTSKVAGVFSRLRTILKPFAEAVLKANVAINLGSAAVQTGVGSATSVTSFQASRASAEVKDIQAFLNELQQLIEQQGDDLEAIMSKLSDSFDALFNVMESSTDTQNKILSELQQMA